MEEQKFPSELITLPSKGLLYAEDKSPLKKRRSRNEIYDCP